MGEPLTAVEFFSGIGAFADACRETSIRVVAAFDQNENANQVYKSNFQASPSTLNLESIDAADIPEASIWWMSPPCTPFSRRGKQRDDEDPRARALLNIIDLLPERLPDYVFVENVEGFFQSRTEEHLLKTLRANGYEFMMCSMCSTDFGVPMRRPRYFIIGKRRGTPCPPDLSALQERRRLRDYLECNGDEQLIMAPKELERYRPVLNIVNPDDEDAYVICFTRGYFKCRKASGSLIQLPDGRVRFFSPKEILDLFGFSSSFEFPSTMPLSTQWRLVGNSVDVRAIKALLSGVS